MKPFHKEDATTIYNGHAIEVLKQLPDESIQMCMTSPPYWGLRNYSGGSDIVWGGDENCEHKWGETIHKGRVGWEATPEGQKQFKSATTEQYQSNSNFCSLCGAWRGQLGLEPTPELYVEHLMMIFKEVKRVLRKDSSFYLNIGDTYAGSWSDSGHRPERTGVEGHQRAKNTEWLERKGHPQMNIPPTRQFLSSHNFQPKCMVCIPERVMFAMIDDGWILRNKNIWHKPNSMPSSVKDRFTTTWEYLYFFVKARKYYFDLDAVREPHKTQSLERYQRGVNLDRPAIGKSAEVGPMQQYTRAPQWFQDEFPPDEDYKGKFDDIFGHGPNPQSFNLRVRDVKRGKGGATAQGGELKASEKEIEEYEYPEKHHGSSHDSRAGLGNLTKHDQAVNRTGNVAYTDSLHTRDYSPKGKNPGDVIADRPKSNKYPARQAHRPHQWEPEQQSSVYHNLGKNPGDYWEITTQPSSICVCPSCSTVFKRMTKICPKCGIKGVTAHFAPFPERLCERPILASSQIDDVILDFFAGTGTVGVVAKKLGRKAILIDYVEDYCIMARDRLSKVIYQPELELE